MNAATFPFLAPAYHDGLIAAAILAGVVLVALLVQRLLFALLLRLLRDRHEGILAALVHRAQAPAGFALPLLAAVAVIPELKFPTRVDTYLVRLTVIASIVAFAWGIVASVGLYTDLMKRKYRIDVEDNLRARQVETRIDILARSIATITVIVATALVAMTFPSIRAIGTGLLASAGVAGIVVGLAARPLFENLVAGVQIALTQPIRIDDVVIVEGEYGHVEQIGATYVVVNIWDGRRMVLPLTYFIEKPFQNWTRTGAALLGTVFLYLDYTVPVDAVRAQLPKILANEKLWDGAVQGVQVTDAKEATVELRILVSARNSAQLFDLRCNVREKLLTWMQATYPTALPTERQLVLAGAGAAEREPEPALRG
jgi:small-conductance mechanosensitive channel